MKNMRVISFIFGFLLIGIANAGARPPVPGTESLSTSQVVADVLFSEAERRVLSDYLRDCRGRYEEDRCWDYGGHDADSGKKPKSLPPGLEKKLERGGELPPGWQMKVARGEVLDRGFYRSYSRSLPEEILRRLPVGPKGTTIRRIEDRVVRVNDDTLLVLDVLSALGR